MPNEPSRNRFDPEQFKRGLDASINEAFDKLRAEHGLPPLDPNRPGPIEAAAPPMGSAEEFRRIQQERARRAARAPAV